jgi:hypothetical protein
MKDAVEIDLGAMIYIPSFIKIGSGIRKLIRGAHIETDTHTDNRVISYVYYSFYFQNKENGLQIVSK